MPNELEVIQSQMDETTSSLARKLTALEDRVLGGVEGTAEAVTSTVETVKDTVKHVKEALDVRKHVQERPWTMMGGAFGVGLLGGLLLPGGKRTEESPATEAAPRSPARETESEPGPLTGLFQMLRGLALGAVFQQVRDLVVRSLPPNAAPDVARWVDDFAVKMGANPLTSSSATGESASATDESVVPFRQQNRTQSDKKAANGVR